MPASANYGKGRESGNGISHNETTLDAGQTVTLNAGRDATLKGAQVSGEQITADVKRHLTLSSKGKFSLKNYRKHSFKFRYKVMPHYHWPEYPRQRQLRQRP
nr:hemagglutinin repeat-containing protein [Photorhabdus luminescens]